MNKKFVIVVVLVISVLCILVYALSVHVHTDNKITARTPIGIGVRGNVPDDAPPKKEMKNFSIPIPGVLSRSGQPSMSSFRWLRDNGWKSVVSLRQDGEKGDAIDSSLSGFNELGFNFLSIPVKDGSVPTEQQAIEFLQFMSNRNNLPAHIHCAAGVGRTGVFLVVYRYSIEGYSMNEAIEEMKLFRDDDISKEQREFFTTWEKNHIPGDGI